MGLNVTGFSYAGTMWICAVSCREMLPDPAFFAECLRESFGELRSAAERHAAVGVVPALPAPAKPRRRAAAKSKAKAAPGRARRRAAPTAPAQD